MRFIQKLESLEIQHWLTKRAVFRTVLAIILITLIWLWLDGIRFFYRIQQASIINQPSLPEKLPLPSPMQYGALARASLFGEYMPDNIHDGSIKASLLNVEVVGIVFSPKEKDSQVILRLSDNEERVYHVGEQLRDGVVIKRITPQGLLIEREGELERLSLPKDELTFEPVPPPLIKESH